jgi:MFS family permease
MMDSTLDTRPEPSKLRLAAITCFATTFGCLYSSMGMIVLPTEVMRLWPETSAMSLGLLLAMTGITQLVAPIAGYYSDRCTLALGRRRPYMLVGSALIIAGLGGMYAGRTLLNGALFAAALFVTVLGLNTAYTGHAGLMPDLLPESIMGTVSGLVAVFNSIGAACAFYSFGFARLPIEYAYVSYAIVTAVTVTTSCCVAHERPLTSSRPISAREILTSYTISEATHGDFYWVFWIRACLPASRCARPLPRPRSTLPSPSLAPSRLEAVPTPHAPRARARARPACTPSPPPHIHAGTLYYMGVSTHSFMMLYLRDVTLPRSGPHPFLGLDDESMSEAELAKHYVGIIALFGQFGALVVAVPLGRLSDTYGRKPFIHLSIAMMCTVYIYYMTGPTITWTLLVGVIFGAGNGAFLAVDYALAVDTLPDKAAAAKGPRHAVREPPSGPAPPPLSAPPSPLRPPSSHRDPPALFADLGIWGVSGFIGGSLGPLCLGPLLHIVGRMGGDDDGGGGGGDAGGGGVAGDGEVPYALAGYQAELILAVAFCVAASYFLHVAVRAK